MKETYNIVYSAALGGAKLMEIDVNGDKAKGYVYGGGMLIAKQEVYQSTNSSAVKWQHQNPGSGSWVETASNRAYERQEMDPLGQETGAIDPFLINPNSNYGDIHGDTPMFVDGGDPFHLSDGCGDIDGMPTSCEEPTDRMLAGAVESSYPGVMINDRNGMRGPARNPIADYGLGLFGILLPNNPSGETGYHLRILDLSRFYSGSQNPGFHIGKYGFDNDESEQLI